MCKMPSYSYTRGFLKFITFSTVFDFNYHVEEEYNAFVAYINGYCCCIRGGLIDVTGIGRVDGVITRNITSS